MDRFQQLRFMEAIFFAASHPVAETTLVERMPEGADIKYSWIGRMKWKTLSMQKIKKSMPEIKKF